MAERAGSSRITPRRVLTLLVALLVVGIVISPAAESESGGVLTTFASDPGGARGLYETVRRLGWPTTQSLDRFAAPLDTNAIYAILRPPVDLTSLEASAILDAVRGGAGLLLVPRFSTTLMDSLGLERTFVTGTLRPLDAEAWDSLGIRPSLQWPDYAVEMTDSAPSGLESFLAGRMPGAPNDSVSFVALRGAVGRGRVVVLADGAILANGMLRSGDNARLPVRMLEWLAPGERPTVVFAEYHQGHGLHASPVAAVRRELISTPVGRVVTHLLVAGGILLLAVGIRPVLPRARARVERRSPLEHISALAQAYEQIGATRTAVRRLIRGLRRRHPIGSLRSAPDAEYLTTLAARHPAVAAEVDLLKAALDEQPSPERLRDAGAAIASIERILRT